MMEHSGEITARLVHVINIPRETTNEGVDCATVAESRLRDRVRAGSGVLTGR